MSLTFDRRRVAAVAIIFKSSILFGKRMEEYEGNPVPYGGYWSVFGGAVEEGESPFQAAAREVYEETQITIPLVELKFIKIIEEDDLDFILYAYEAPDLLVPTLDYEHSEYGWYQIEELHRFPYKIDPKIVEGVNLYIQRRRGEETHCQKKN